MTSIRSVGRGRLGDCLLQDGEANPQCWGRPGSAKVMRPMLVFSSGTLGLGAGVFIAFLFVVLAS
jgi:hypothetical protein